MNRKGTFTAYRIQSVRIENKTTRTLVFDAPLEDVQPGQYVMAWLPGIGEKPFSISGDEPFALTIADVGPVSRALTRLKVGERVWVRGPLGRGFSLTSQSHLLVGGGYGAAPLSLLARRARKVGHSVAVALGAKSEGDLMMVSTFEEMGCQVYTATEDGSCGVRGLVTAAVEAAYDECEPRALYACGPNPMLITLAAYAHEKELPAQLSFEALIRCGIGLCGSCELPEEVCAQLGISPGFLVCHDGPVVNCKIPLHPSGGEVR
jgi:dihydroorotate dehydrogenase electron transfer subunit